MEISSICNKLFYFEMWIQVSSFHDYVQIMCTSIEKSYIYYVKNTYRSSWDALRNWCSWSILQDAFKIILSSKPKNLFISGMYAFNVHIYLYIYLWKKNRIQTLLLTNMWVTIFLKMSVAPPSKRNKRNQTKSTPTSYITQFLIPSASFTF